MRREHPIYLPAPGFASAAASALFPTILPCATGLSALASLTSALATSLSSPSQRTPCCASPTAAGLPPAARSGAPVRRAQLPNRCAFGHGVGNGMPGRRRALLADQRRRAGINLHAPHHREQIALIALEDAHPHRLALRQKAHRFVKAAADLAGFVLAGTNNTAQRISNKTVRIAIR